MPAKTVEIKGDGNCAYNALAISLFEQIARYGFAFKDDEAISNNYHDLLDLADPKWMPNRDLLSVQERLKLFLEIIPRANINTIQIIMAPAFRAYLDKILREDNETSQKYKEQLCNLLDETLEDHEYFILIKELSAKFGIPNNTETLTIAVELRNVPGLKGKIEEIYNKDISLNEKKLLLKAWFHTEGFKLHLKNDEKTGISDYAVYVGADEYKLLAPLLSLDIFLLQKNNEVYIEGADPKKSIISMQKIKQTNNDHWDILIDDDEFSSLFLKDPCAAMQVKKSGTQLSKIILDEKKDEKLSRSILLQDAIQKKKEETKIVIEEQRLLALIQLEKLSVIKEKVSLASFFQKYLITAFSTCNDPILKAQLKISLKLNYDHFKSIEEECKLIFIEYKNMEIAQKFKEIIQLLEKAEEKFKPFLNKKHILERAYNIIKNIFSFLWNMLKFVMHKIIHPYPNSKPTTAIVTNIQTTINPYVQHSLLLNAIQKQAVKPNKVSNTPLKYTSKLTLTKK